MEENVRDLSNPVEFKAAFPVEHRECRLHKTVLPRPRKKSALRLRAAKIPPAAERSRLSFFR